MTVALTLKQIDGLFGDTRFVHFEQRGLQRLFGPLEQFLQRNGSSKHSFFGSLEVFFRVTFELKQIDVSPQIIGQICARLQLKLATRVNMSIKF